MSHVQTACRHDNRPVLCRKLVMWLNDSRGQHWNSSALIVAGAAPWTRPRYSPTAQSRAAGRVVLTWRWWRYFSKLIIKYDQLINCYFAHCLVLIIMLYIEKVTVAHVRHASHDVTYEKCVKQCCVYDIILFLIVLFFIINTFI